MKTVQQRWILTSGSWYKIYKSRSDIMVDLSTQSFLEGFPEKTCFVVSPCYEVVDFEVPGMEYYEQPKLLN